MVRTCCVPGCRSNYNSELKKSKDANKTSLTVSNNCANSNVPASSSEKVSETPEVSDCNLDGNDKLSTSSNYVPVFLLPKNEELRKQWVKNIPRDKWEPSNNHAVCIKHFEDKDVDMYDEVTDADGQVKKIRKFRPLLRPDAVPRIFRTLAEYLNKPPLKERVNPSSRKRKYEDKSKTTRAEYEEQEDWLENDKIQDCHTFRKEVLKYVQNLKKNWVVAMNSTLVIIYFLENLTEIPQICCSVTIDNELNIKVCVRGNIVAANDLAWIISPNEAVERWSQLESILSRYHEPSTIKANESSHTLDRIHFLEESLPKNETH